MNNKMMWTYMLQLGSNMWGKKGARYPYPTNGAYHETMFTDKETWKQVVDFLPECGINTLLIDVGEGVKLDSHPELAIPGSWEKQELREELQRIRELGITPIPKLNFSGEHNAWLQDYRLLVTTDTYYKVTTEIIEEVIDIFDTPEFFHLGLDEEGTMSIQYAPVTVVRSAFQYVEDAQKLFQTCLNKGVRPWIWLTGHDIKACFGGDENFCAKVPKEVLVSNWYYHTILETRDQDWVRLWADLAKWGYEQIPTCSNCFDGANPFSQMNHCKAKVDPASSLRGYMMAPWMDTIPENLYALKDGAWKFAIARNKAYPDVK